MSALPRQIFFDKTSSFFERGGNTQDLSERLDEAQTLNIKIEFIFVVISARPILRRWTVVYSLPTIQDEVAM